MYMDFSLCPYKNLFGEPNTGLRKYRIFNISIIDTIIVIIFGYFFAKYNNLDLKEILILLFTLGIILHNIFCVRTSIDKFLFR